MNYTINYIFLYAILGFILESFYYKLHNANLHSGIFYGPYNFIYGIGMFICLITQKYLSLSINIINIIIYYLIFVLITTTIEFISGHLIHYLLKFDKWDYLDMPYHFGKYICLRNSLIWGLLSLICIFILNPYLFNNYLYNIPKYFTNIIIIIFIIDFLLSFKKYFIKKI